MRRALRLIVLTVGAALLLIVIAFLTIGRETYVGFVEQQIISAARDAGVLLSLRGTGLYPFGVTAEKMTATVPRALLVLELEHVDAHASLLDILGLSPNVLFRGEVYGGEFHGSVIAGPKSQYSLALDRIQLTQVPQLVGFGVTGGIMNLAIPHASADGGQSIIPEITATIVGFEKPGTLKLPSSLTGLPIPLVLPEILTGSLTFTGSVKPEQIDIRQLDTTSSLGAISVTGTIQRAPRGAITAMNLALVAHLTAPGIEVFRPSFLFIPGAASDPPPSDFKLFISGVPPFPKMRLERIGALPPA